MLRDYPLITFLPPKSLLTEVSPVSDLLLALAGRARRVEMALPKKFLIFLFRLISFLTLLRA